jgi:hypothetical protein
MVFMKKLSMNSPNKLKILIAGILCGIIVTSAGLTVEYKGYRHFKKPKRFDTRAIMADLKGATITKDQRIFVASSLDRIFLDGMTLHKPAFSMNASVSAAANEYESFQIVINPSQRDLKSVVVDTTNLKDAKTGAQISKENITPYLMGYVETHEPYYPVKYIGLWPDPLLPLKSATVKAGQFQSVWINIYVPQKTPPGDYQGRIIIRGENLAEQTVPIAVHVYDFTLPIESHLKTAFDFYGHITKARYPQGEKESEAAWQARIDAINEKFLIEMLKHRMNPILNIDPTNQGHLGAIDRFRVYGINNFSIGKRGGTFNNNWPTDDESINNLQGLYQTYAELLRLNQMLNYTYIYTWDEGEIGNPVVAKVTAMIHNAFKGLKNMVCYHGFWDPDVIPNWGKDIDIWCFNIDDYNDALFYKLKNRGIEMWMYISGMSGTGAPNLGIDFDSMDYRIVPWLCWKYDIKGFLYWCVNWWATVDPFESAANTKWGQNGNGLLFYPGENGPLPSVRTEVFRDGMEDYEYIQTLIKRAKQLKIMKLGDKYKTEINQAIKLMTVDPTIAGSLSEFTKDNEVLQNRRDAIARKIEEFNQLIEKNRPAPAPQPIENNNVPAQPQ